jgi:hypothetical protein
MDPGDSSLERFRTASVLPVVHGRPTNPITSRIVSRRLTNGRAFRVRLREIELQNPAPRAFPAVRDNPHSHYMEHLHDVEFFTSAACLSIVNSTNGDTWVQDEKKQIRMQIEATKYVED